MLLGCGLLIYYMLVYYLVGWLMDLFILLVDVEVVIYVLFD